MDNKTTETIQEIIKKGVIKFNKPYVFETQEYLDIDLSSLEDITTDDLLKVENIYHKSGGNAINPELTVLYSMTLAHVASGMPLEFFGKLPAREAMKIKKEVFNFFYK